MSEGKKFHMEHLPAFEHAIRAFTSEMFLEDGRRYARWSHQTFAIQSTEQTKHSSIVFDLGSELFLGRARDTKDWEHSDEFLLRRSLVGSPPRSELEEALDGNWRWLVQGWSDGVHHTEEFYAVAVVDLDRWREAQWHLDERDVRGDLRGKYGPHNSRIFTLTPEITPWHRGIPHLEAARLF